MHYKDKNLQIDIRCHTVFMNDQKIELSLKEFTVLKYLTEHPGWVFSHEEIYRNVWKEEPIDCANAVMCCISQLRKKLKVDSRNWNYIRTVRGVGYKFQPLWYAKHIGSKAVFFYLLLLFHSYTTIIL